MNGTLVHQIGVAKQFQPDKPERVEADTTTQVDMGLELATRSANPGCRPPEAQPAKAEVAPAPRVTIVHY